MNTYNFLKNTRASLDPFCDIGLEDVNADIVGFSHRNGFHPACLMGANWI